MIKNQRKKLGIALSGGGVRAAVFHLGALLRLAKDDLLEQIDRISSVSGGSLLIGLIFSLNGHKWPTSTSFPETIYPRIKALLTEKDLFSIKAILQSPTQLHNILHQRSKILVHLLEKRWGVYGKLHELPDRPYWIINTTCITTGKNWRFSKMEMGDWKFGRHYDPPFSISQAIAASAAVPYVIGGLGLALPWAGWFEVDPATSEPLKEKKLLSNQIVLWDGGAYENLGIEPLYKPGRRMIKCDDILVSDASAPANFAYKKRNPGKILKGNLTAPRLFDITSDQIRSLRSRIFLDALANKKA